MTTNEFMTDLAAVRRIADHWRSIHGPKPYDTEGFVVVYHGRGTGWTRALNEPEKWCPDCIAVAPGPAGDCFVALGGDDHRGAERWETLTEGTA